MYTFAVRHTDGLAYSRESLELLTSGEALRVSRVVLVTASPFELLVKTRDCNMSFMNHTLRKSLTSWQTTETSGYKL